VPTRHGPSLMNPTRTIQALALYVADSMKQRLATLFD
jgi:hypothetical protein